MPSTVGLSGQDILSAARRLRPLITEFAREHYGSVIATAAWQDFSRWGQGVIARDQQAYQSAFTAWYLYTWLPDDTDLSGAKFQHRPSDHALGFDYLSGHRDELSPLEQGIIEVAATAPYSFYKVESAESDARLKLREIYTGQRVVVEGVAATAYAAGDILFSAVLSVNGVSVLLGCMPTALGAAQLAKIEAHREKWSEEEGAAIDRRLLYLHDTELRRFYFVMLAQVQRASLH